MWKLYYRHKIQTVILLYIITKTVRFNYIRSSRRQVPREIQLEKRFTSLNFRHPLESKECPKFRLKDFPRQLFTVSVSTR